MKTPDFHAFARNRSLPLWLLGLVLPSFPAWTEDLDVTANMSLPPGDYEYDALMVRTGATLTLQGDPATGTGVTLRVTGMVVETGATVTATAQGYGAQAGPGAATNDRAGGSHGGRGGGTDPAETYGSAVAPTDLGSGGWSAGGGGSIKLEVADLLQIDGTLSANGEFGGGAGGSIFIETGRIAGGGLLQANGGRGQCGACSASIPGGGGGRIAIHH
ncbi:MAG: hypothetical protein KDM81_18845, partial [Verrucomicrobiae bacterium]|nr:hypothetical protein [Verrucomicrobiae bacterium]